MLARLLMTMSVPLAALAQSMFYPETPRGETVDDYFGVKVADPYRWLEDDRSEKTAAWVKAQNQVTRGFLDGLPARQAIAERLTSLWNYERFGMPHRKGQKVFYTRNSGLQNQSLLYVAEGVDGPPRLLLDPNILSADGTVSLTEMEPSEDGTKVVYGTSAGGSDWHEFRVRDVTTGQDEADHLKWIKFSGASWARDGSGFYYSRYPEPVKGQELTAANKNQKLYFHKLGTAQADDRLIYERPDQPDWGIHGSVSDEGDFLLIHVTQGTDPRNRFYYLDLRVPDAQVVRLLDGFDANYSLVHIEGRTFYFQTTNSAPRERIVAIDLDKPEPTAWREIIPETEHLLQGSSVVGGQLICTYLEHAKSVVRCFSVEGKVIRDVALPGIGSVGGFGGKSADADCFFSFTGFSTPGCIYRYEVATGRSTLWKQPVVGFDAAQLEVRQVFVASKDGTRVPMFIVHKKGLVLDSSSRCLLYGYGGFNISLTPGFSMARALWIERGGVFAMANLRGGGEYGEDWHAAGTKLKKQNVFDDFISCAEWLVAERYTKSSLLAIQGGSNGGLLVGACMTQRPDLFGAALPAVGVMDMLRFHKFTIGWAWKSDYGSSESEPEFRALHAYSPLHQLKPGSRYPATLVMTADHDDRVVPAHSFKFAAQLQHCQAKEGPPVLIRIETSAGHGAGTALKKVIEETADQWAFLEHVLR
jgi:prolyl oligopeptidase